MVAALLGNACGGDSSSDSAAGPADSEATLSSSSICEDCDESSSSVTPQSSRSSKVPATGEESQGEASPTYPYVGLDPLTSSLRLSAQDDTVCGLPNH